MAISTTIIDAPQKCMPLRKAPSGALWVIYCRLSKVLPVEET
jgi:hypothetical protein